jgi:hypothetical protein
LLSFEEGGNTLFTICPDALQSHIIEFMKLSLGIVGLPNVGKSTLFKILTSQDILIANYPFATIDPNVGVVAVPDERLKKLADISHSKKVIPAVVEFYDIAGLVKGASKGEGLGNQFLSHIRETQAVVIVLRLFPNPDIVHVENSVDPVRDLEIINTELILKDLETVEKRLAKAQQEARSASSGQAKSGDKAAVKNMEALAKVKDALERGALVRQLEDVADEPIIKELQLLTSKRQLYLLNGERGEVTGELEKKIRDLGADYLALNLAKAKDVPELIAKAYETLNLISFFTTGEDETRAWTVAEGTKAPQAAGVIHTDFEKKFIRAEVISCQELLEAGGWNQAKQKGWLRLEGKEYLMQDGDVMVVRHG